MPVTEREGDTLSQYILGPAEAEPMMADLKAPSFLTLVVFVLLTLIGPRLVAAQGYAITDLGTLGGQRSWAYSINAAGEVVGGSVTPDGQEQAFRWRNGQMLGLGTAGHDGSFAIDINDAGTVTGWVSTTTPYLTRAFVYEEGRMVVLGTLGGRDSVAWAINNQGHVVGFSDTLQSEGRLHVGAFLYDGSGMRDLGGLGGPGSWSAAFGINDLGQIVGRSMTQRREERPFLYSDGQMRDLGSLGGSTSTAYGINNAGQIVGSSMVPTTYRSHAFLYAEGRMIDLGTLGPTESRAEAINARGQVVGWYVVSPEDITIITQSIAEVRHPFLWQNGRMTDLHTLLPPGSGWRLVEATDINDSGQIVGYGINPGKETRGFLLTPVP
jgi:probable HAF family extracellular repeat protein